MTDDMMRNLNLAFPIGPKIAAGTGSIPRDGFGRRVIIRVLPMGVPGYSTPWGLTRKTVNKRRGYEATWMDTNNRAFFTRQRDAADFLDLHRYAVGYRRITGTLPAWATDKGWLSPWRTHSALLSSQRTQRKPTRLKRWRKSSVLMTPPTWDATRYQTKKGGGRHAVRLHHGYHKRGRRVMWFRGIAEALHACSVCGMILGQHEKWCGR